MEEKKVRIGLLGCGTVGSQVVRILQEKNADLSARSGARLEISGIAVRNLEKYRAQAAQLGVDETIFDTEIDRVIAGADLVIELMGGLEPARSAMLQALRAGKTVVTGNKAVLAESGPALHQTALENSADLYFEAAVAGAVPVVYGLRESLTGDQINQVLGIVNGTTNFILDQMTTQGWDYATALKKAQDLGFAEADPTADVEGHDAAAKCAILASLAFHTRVGISDVPVRGISQITAQDIKTAADNGYVIKLIAKAERVTTENGEEVALSVGPTLVPNAHPLANISGPYNAIVLESQFAGRLMFYGAGAGGSPTASAVLSDVVAGAHHVAYGGHAPHESAYAQLPICDPDRAAEKLQVQLEVVDQPGTLAAIAQIYQAGGVSIASVMQPPAQENRQATALVLTTHAAPHGAQRKVLEGLAASPAVKNIAATLPVLED